MNVLRCVLAGLALLAAGCATVDSELNPVNAHLHTGDGPLVQAHRGGRHEYDDNAAGGFARSLAAGVRGFETDVRFSSDHELVVMHDASLKRTSTGTTLVEETPFADIRQCRLQGSGENVPGLKDVLATLSGRTDVFIELEMKAYPSAFYTPETLEEYCRALDLVAKVMLKPGTYVFTSFNETTLATMRRVDAFAPLALISSQLTDAQIEAAKALKCCGISPTLKTATPELVERLHREGFSVALWMVQNTEEYAQAKAMGADRVTSDYPIALVKAVE